MSKIELQIWANNEAPAGTKVLSLYGGSGPYSTTETNNILVELEGWTPTMTYESVQGLNVLGSYSTNEYIEPSEITFTGVIERATIAELYLVRKDLITRRNSKAGFVLQKLIKNSSTTVVTEWQKVKLIGIEVKELPNDSPVAELTLSFRNEEGILNITS